MEFLQTKLEGSFVIQPIKIKDKRGFYCRVCDSNLSKKSGLQDKFIQSNLVSTKKRGTLRGLHYQKHPFQEIKVTRCIKGSIFVVIVDLRKKSSTYLKWYGTKLSKENNKSLYVPKNFAHGYITLEDETDIFYQSSNTYSPKHESGISWNDPKIKIKWPIKPIIISKKDSSWKDIK
jgi:dTDP-4-dehydrorhamnose 3,5-epimerase